MPLGEELFSQQILEERDRLSKEASKLKSQLAGYENFETKRATYEQQLEESKQPIINLKQQGISIAPATGRFQHVADLLRPAYYRLKELVLASGYIHNTSFTKNTWPKRYLVGHNSC